MPNLWDLLVTSPFINILLFLYSILFNNLTLTIVIITVLIRAITFPMIQAQNNATKRQREMMESPEWKGLQQKYADNKEKMQMEQMRLMQEAGVNPLAGCLPLLIQLPVFIGLSTAITSTTAGTPLQLLNLSTHLYPFFPNPENLIPLDNRFLWMNLGLPDPLYVMPILVVVTSWIQSKIMVPPAADEQTMQTMNTTTIMMTVMFGYLSITFPSGLSIYFIVSNILSIAQYAFTNPVNWRNIFTLNAKPAPVAVAAPVVAKKVDGKVVLPPPAPKKVLKKKN